MMAETDREDRTLPASPRRLEKAREEGRVARSRELSGFLVAAAAFGGIALQGPALLESARGLMRSGLAFDRAAAFQPTLALTRAGDLSTHAAASFGPLMLLLVLAAAIAPLAVGGWLFSWHPVLPALHRVNPLSGLGRIASLQSWVEIGKSILKALALAGAAVWVLWNSSESLAGLGSAGPAGSLALAGQVVEQGVAVLLAALAAIAAVDVPIVLFNHHRSLRMTRREMQDEQREAEGDPQLKARVRATQRAAARRRMMAAVPKATVVVTNPTHYAVAIDWREGASAPRVVAKGSGEVARRIREVAAAAGVPLLEAPPLARALHRHAELDREIPAALYHAVATVLAWVFHVRTATARGRPHPKAPNVIVVPTGMDPGEDNA